MTIAAVYSYAQRRGHLITDISYQEAVSASVQLSNGQCCIGIDRKRIKTEAEEKTVMLHELGHCERGAFYTRSCPIDNRTKCEEMADRWAIKKELSYKKLLRAMQSGHTEAYDLADYFGVTEEMIRKAYQYYTEACGLKFL